MWTEVIQECEMKNSAQCGFDETAYKLATFFVTLTEAMILQYLFKGISSYEECYQSDRQ